jgi:hypothetical protein
MPWSPPSPPSSPFFGILLNYRFRPSKNICSVIIIHADHLCRVSIVPGMEQLLVLLLWMYVNRGEEVS